MQNHFGLSIIMAFLRNPFAIIMLPKLDLALIESYISSYPLSNSNSNNSTFDINELEPEVKWRKYYQKQNGIRYKHLIPFSNVAKVVRGIATGANDYFTFSKSKANQYEIDEKYLLPCICKAVDVKDNFFTKDNFNSLVNSEKQTFLFNATGSKNENVLKYIKLGEKNRH
jgi:adenine-specific DNA-methyltransferase